MSGTISHCLGARPRIKDTPVNVEAISSRGQETISRLCVGDPQLPSIINSVDCVRGLFMLCY